MASTFPSCVVCGRSALVVFPFVFTEVSLHIIIFTWMTDHTSVMIVFSLCCFYSALSCTALSLYLCCKVPLLSNSAAPSLPIFQSAAAHLPLHIQYVWPPCISTFTGNCSLGALESNMLCEPTDHRLRAGLPGKLSFGLNCFSSLLLKLMQKYNCCILRLSS